jgi:hypothetical protein
MQTSESLREKLKQDGEKTVAFFQLLPEEKWHLLVYNDGIAWNVKDILAHFVVSEAGFCQLIENILAGGSGAPEQFDIDEFNRQEVKKLTTVSREDLLENFQKLRQHTLGLMEGVSQQDLLRVGRHPFLGEAELIDIIKLIYRHNQIHLRDLKRIFIERP